MASTSASRRWLLIGLCTLLTLSGPALGLVEPEDPTPELTRHHPDLDIAKAYLSVSQLPAADARRAREDLQALGINIASARIDTRSGGWETLLPVEPLWPGDGVGNRLRWSDLGLTAEEGQEALEQVAWDAFASYLEAHHQQLRIDLAEIPSSGRVTTHDDGKIVNFYVPRVVGGVAVRDSYLTAVANRGNLILFGAQNWADIDVSTQPGITSVEAGNIVREHLRDHFATATFGKNELVLVPLAKGGDPGQVDLGNGYTFRLVWAVEPHLEGDHSSWEALVDAHTGELISFQDTNHYAEVKGGVYPVTNDGIAPDGVEQPGWPMPFDNLTHSGGTATTDSGGNIPGGVSGTRTSTLSGQFVRMNDNCGAISLSSTGDIDFGTSGGDDCTTPGFGGAGNTHSSRTGFHELNRIIEMARSHLPGNTWLQQQLTANMNINNTCNAFWNGVTVNFYRSGGGCFNTGEIAGVFDHEWGHGIDDNDAVPTIAGPSGEGIADIYTAMRLNTSCIGRNFRATVCTGFGDPCLTCTGVRDIDYLQRQSGQPHDYSWSNANCGGSVHCVGAVYAEAFWSLWKRELQSAPYNYSDHTAHEIVNRLTFIGAGNTGTWFSGGPPNGGCSAGSGYMNYLAVDDDNGNLNDGTPHMGAIFTAFDDQEIACGTPTVQDSGCAGTPTTAPNVTASPLDKSVSLSWGAVSGATEYEIFRTDGVFACDFGKIKAGTTTGTSFLDTGLQNGRDYSYVVIAKGPADSCFGPASACDTVTPAAGPNVDVDVGSAVLNLSGGDGDAFLDNCESGTFTFDVNNTGIGGLTNVRISNVTSPSHPSITFNTSFPAATSPSSIPEGGSATGSFSFTAAGLSFNDTVTFVVEVTADEISPIVKSANLEVASVESDFQSFASKTFTFESGTEDWQTIQGTFNRTSSGGGAQGTTWYEASSANLDNQCDHIRSPIVTLTATSTMTLWNQFDIEPQFTNGVWYDRANVGVYEVANGNRTSVDPDSGRLYNASGPQGTCGTTGQNGWADAATAWASSGWSSGALGSAGFAGQQVQLDIRYGTDAVLNGFGFHFDQVTLTNFNQQVPDTQSDSCGCNSNPECDDGLFCNGAETCNLGTNTCEPGTPPNCDDGVSCTDDSCNEGTDSCDNVANNANCDNGLFCDGSETCDPVLDCQAGTAPDCDDGVGCTDDSCNEGTDSCDNVANNANCDDGAFCNGAETCDPALDCQAGTPPCGGGQTCNEQDDICEGGANAQLESDCLTVGGSATTVNLTNTYVNPVVVTSAQYDNNTIPVVTRVSAVTSNSFAVRLQNPSGSAVAAENVCYLVVEEGTWNIDGFAIEAQRYTSTVTDDAPSNWVGQAQSYGQSYTNPVVLGQVMSENDAGFSVFWDMATTRANPPTAANLTTGKTVCEDTDVTRNDEVVGFVVIEAGHGTIGGVEFEAATGADNVAGVTNAPPYAYTFNTAFASAPTVATVQMAAVDGNNGGWAQVHGPTMATATTLNLSIDEDQIADTERSHTTEQVAYAVFAGPVVYPPPASPTVMEWGTVTAGTAPVTVNLTGSYTDPVVVTAINYANNTTPVVTRISSVTGSSFAVNLQNAGAGTVAAETITYLVVEAGVHNIGGTLIEAQTYTSTVTDENNSWVGQAQTLAATFTNPVVLGQVMSSNDPDWSVFWDQGTARTNPPVPGTLVTGKTVCEDTLTTRANETVGFVVFEAGHGTIGGVEFEAALGADSVEGVGNSPPYTYTFNTPFASLPRVPLVTMAGVDGGNGGWAYVFGASPISTTTLNLAIDEDTIGDGERGHITEQVAYVVFAAAGSAP